MFDQHYKKESPTFTGITRGVGGFGFGAASAAGGGSVPREYYWTSRATGMTDGAYSQDLKVPHSGFTNSYGTPKSGYTTGGSGIINTGWHHGINNTDGLVFYVEAASSTSIYLDHVSSSSLQATSSGSSIGSGLPYDLKLYIWHLGGNQSNSASSSSIIKQYNYGWFINAFNMSNSAYMFFPTGAQTPLYTGVIDTPLLQAGNFYAVGVDIRDRKYTGSSGEYITSGSYLTGFSQKTYSPVIWQDGTHAVNIYYYSTPNYSGYQDNGTSSSSGQFCWWKWRRAE
tara:strand:- start:176 stop:1027 length:852 start_codon:yes stop_codon:yes gene_type:complete